MFQVEKVETDLIKIRESIEDYNTFEAKEEFHEFFVCSFIKKRK